MLVQIYPKIATLFITDGLCNMVNYNIPSTNSITVCKKLHNFTLTTGECFTKL